jgi:hypothetical protein
MRAKRVLFHLLLNVVGYLYGKLSHLKHMRIVVAAHKLLKKLYPSENVQSIANILGRSLGSVANKASSIGLKKAETPPVWSRQEEALLRKLYPNNSISVKVCEDKRIES